MSRAVLDELHQPSRLVPAPAGADTSRIGDKDGTKLVNQWFKLSESKRRQLVENLLSKITVDRSEVDFDLKFLPGQAGKNCSHSQEGDYGNACYWYSRAGKPAPPADASLDEEWRQIADALA